MQLKMDSEKPIFQQFAEGIEDNILKGIYAEESQIPSTTEVAVKLKINPATANRGENLLVDEGIIYKKRGIGMFVSAGAREKIITKRKSAFYDDFVRPLLIESKNLNLTREDVNKMIDRGFRK
jgi:DNA-binding transcriptional regulator YhcF (GntR family)